MDKQDPPSWRSRFRNIFGSNSQLRNSAQQQPQQSDQNPSASSNIGLDVRSELNTHRNLHQQESRESIISESQQLLNAIGARIRNCERSSQINPPQSVQPTFTSDQQSEVRKVPSIDNRMDRRNSNGFSRNMENTTLHAGQEPRNCVTKDAEKKGQPKANRNQQSGKNERSNSNQHRSRSQNTDNRNELNVPMSWSPSQQTNSNANKGHAHRNRRRATMSGSSQQQRESNDTAWPRGQMNRGQQSGGQTSHQTGSGSNVKSENRNQTKRAERHGGMNQSLQQRHGQGDAFNRNRSNSNLSQTQRGTNIGGGRSSTRGNGQRQTFFGLKKFENYLETPADSVVISLHLEMEAFEGFLKEARAYEGTMFETLLKVLSEKVFSDDCNLVNYQNDIARLIAYPDVMNRFRDKCMTMDDSQFAFMFNVADFLKRRMPVSAADNLSGLVTFCIARLGMIQNNPQFESLHKQFQELFQSLHEKRQLQEAEAKARQPFVRGKFTDNDMKSFDKLTPPDDFRAIPIIPTKEELLSTELSFLRPNKQAGAYASAHHYLDVQFRLLREDFLQPLKQGIQQYLSIRKTTNNPRMPKGSPIRVYYNVKCLTAEVKYENLHYWIELPSDYSKIRWDKSRRLLPGNLVLLTKNSTTFDSILFATVGIRNDEDLKKDRRLSIIPEKEQSRIADVLCSETDLLLIESEVYWESFRHVLKTAQNLNLGAFPLAKYIVSACTNVEHPPSLIDPILNPHEDDYETTIKLSFKRTDFTMDPFVGRTWPTADLIGLDANQFEAFKAALTKQFVIIQGPPGTGKTYVGLRIAEVILQNPQLRATEIKFEEPPALELEPVELGKPSQLKGPLLCICYTNHALDQFLEGILKIMKAHDMDPKIVRVGGRSKSDELREFNLREIVRRTSRQLVGLQWREQRDLQNVMEQNQKFITGLKTISAELERPTGIVQFNTIGDEIYESLCFQFSSQLLEKFMSPTFFKLSNSDVYNITESSTVDAVKKFFVYLPVNKNAKGGQVEKTKQNVPPSVEEDDNAEDDDEEEFYDMDELMEQRIVSDDVAEPVKLQRRFEQSNSVGRYHVKEMSIPYSKFLLTGYKTTIKRNAITDNDSRQVYNAKQRNIAQASDSLSVEQKRLDLLTEIFSCLNGRRVKIPDISTKLEALRHSHVMDSKDVVDKTFPQVAQRYAAYLVVAKRAHELIKEAIRSVEEKLIEGAETISQLKQQHEVEILRNAAVVGMTTTGAAKFNDLLAKMKSRIVIVEEAAEVLEAHIVTSLTKHTDHLILIGDHKQLKPSTAVYELSKKYDLDVSLFERMINNHMTCYSLLAQHRMRSEIADLIRGSIYDNLNDAPNVHEYECITGMTQNLFFLAHENFETSEGDTMSKFNEFEADYLAGLAGYLLKQGYPASSITVLTTYTGQMFLLKSKFRSSESLAPIHITCVDNFQGEENEIILLSLVRSNAAGKMGFLSISNRVCVALSRAKKGLYIIGNMKMLSKQSIWSEINAKLEQRKQIGPKMTVVCQRHQTRSDIAQPDDFIKKCPEGGCLKMCGLLMICSHLCPRFCHAQDMQHKNYRCREMCRKLCSNKDAHPCELGCHYGQKCLPCTVTVNKPRSCGHNIPVDCHRSAEDVYCRTQIKVELKCQHEVNVDCSQKMDDWRCNEIVDRILVCGHETKLMCYVDPNTYMCKIQVKKELPICNHFRTMKCSEPPTAWMCKTLVDKELSCGHNQTVECRLDPQEITCSVKVTVTLDCEHTITVPCFRKTKGKIDCVELCEERLSCGHSCPLKCHYFKDRHHEKFQCKKPCTKSCANGHPCITNHHCSSQCKKCTTIVERAHPVCGHIGKICCFESSAEFQCQEPCTKVLQCGHSCVKKCSDPCGPCTVPTSKSTPVCGHKQVVPCNEYPKSENCDEKIKISSTLCGHEITVPCSMRSASIADIQAHCTAPCNFIFSHDDDKGCGHKCSGTCSSCLMGTLHQKCKDKCLRPLICGHLCDFPCSKNCPPCKKRCRMKCEHSKCKKMCGDACFTCKERCNWRCKHLRCTKLCGEMCDRDPCDEPCDKKLRCGHPCVGLCGEMCPSLCRICNFDELTDFKLLWTEEDADARFIWLPDCGHAIEVEGLTMHFKATDEGGEIGLKRCPRCTELITTLTGRFGNVIRKTFRDVTVVKNKFFGNREQIHKLTEEIQQNLQVEAKNLVTFLPTVKNFFEMIIYFDDKDASTPKFRQVDVHTLNSLKQIWVWVKEVLKNVTDYSSAVIKEDCDTLFGNITSRQLPLCAFEVSNIGGEIQRLVHKIQFNRRWDSSSHGSKERAEAKVLQTKILAALRSTGIYDEKCQRQFIDHIKDLEKILKTGIGISEHERVEIIKALNMRQGHWFKCPNGHPYIITECGGAMETANCNECGERIGGGNHSLLASNQFAPEMDGAARPLWDTVLVPQNFRL